MMHGHEKSRSAIVAVKPTNKAERSAAEQSAAETTAAESVERRGDQGECLTRSDPFSARIGARVSPEKATRLAGFSGSSTRQLTSGTTTAQTRATKRTVRTVVTITTMISLLRSLP